MATGDAAAAAGMDLVSGSAAANTLDTEDNKTRDYVATYTQPVRDATATGNVSGAGGKLVKWGANGNLAVGEPTSSGHAVTKNYADGLVSGATANADPDTLMKRASGGRVNVGTPVNSGNATTKQYVDDGLSQKAEADEVDNIRQGELAGAVYSRDLTGTRRSVFISAPSAGYSDLGYSSSSRYKKQNIRAAELDVEQLRKIPVVLYRYRKAVAAEKAGKIHHAPTEIGTIAEDLHELGLWQFVAYEDGKPVAVHYDLLALAAITLAQHTASRLDDLETRMTSAGI